VVVPYFKSKLQSIYNREREARLQATLWGQDDARFDEVGFIIDQEQTSQAQAEPSSGQVSNLTRFKKNFASLVGVCYPWIHATNEGLPAMHAFCLLCTISSFSVITVSFKELICSMILYY
jgi:peroxin-12